MTSMIAKNWHELIKPSTVEVSEHNEPKTKAKIVVEPLERGFGLTLGNALRRVLLSSLQGASVTAIKMDSVLHEFSSVEGIREDVIDIILNIKGLAISAHNTEKQKLTLKAEGPCTVTAGMITYLFSGDIKISAFYAKTVKRTKEIFEQEEGNFDIIFIDGTLEDGENAVPLAKWFKEQGFEGEMISISDNKKKRKELLEAGCVKCLSPKIELVSYTRVFSQC